MEKREKGYKRKEGGYKKDACRVQKLGVIVIQS
jgi:hypothetical protein